MMAEAGGVDVHGKRVINKPLGNRLGTFQKLWPLQSSPSRVLVLASRAMAMGVLNLSFSIVDA
jgi:hypothetical protein